MVKDARHHQQHVEQFATGYTVYSAGTAGYSNCWLHVTSLSGLATTPLAAVQAVAGRGLVMHAVVTDVHFAFVTGTCVLSSRHVLSMANAHARDQRTERQQTREADTAVPIQPDSEGAGWQEDA